MHSPLDASRFFFLFSYRNVDLSMNDSLQYKILMNDRCASFTHDEKTTGCVASVMNYQVMDDRGDSLFFSPELTRVGLKSIQPARRMHASRE
jgi:hypothetical protein